MTDLSPAKLAILKALVDGSRWVRSFQGVKPLLDGLIEAGLVERCRPHLGRGRNKVRRTATGCDAVGIPVAAVPAHRAAQRPKVGKARAYSRPKAGLTGKTKAICETYVKAMDRGESERDVVGQLSAAHDVRRPSIWKALRLGGVLPPYGESREGGKGRPKGGGVAGYSEDRRAKAVEATERRQPEPDPSLYVNRDPCPFCQVRADIGCRHSGRGNGFEILKMERAA